MAAQWLLQQRPWWGKCRQARASWTLAAGLGKFPATDAQADPERDINDAQDYLAGAIEFEMSARQRRELHQP